MSPDTSEAKAAEAPKVRAIDLKRAQAFRLTERDRREHLGRLVRALREDRRARYVAQWSAYVEQFGWHRADRLLASGSVEPWELAPPFEAEPSAWPHPYDPPPF